MRHTIIALCIVLISGCATTDKPPIVGSKNWHTIRIAEIQSTYDLGQINEDEYLRLKNEADQIYVDYTASRKARSHTSIGIGYGSYRHRGHRHSRPHVGHH